MIRFIHRGHFNATMTFFNRLLRADYLKKLDEYGRKGVAALEAATPKRTGKTASSWGYEIHSSRDDVSIIWTNSNINKGVNIAVILQFGHGLSGGGYVKGIDYINPALKPIFDEIADSAWKEVTSS